MMDKDKIRNIIELFIAWNGETEPIDVANIDSAVEFISSSLQEESVSEDLKKAAEDYSNNLDNIVGSIGEQTRNAFKAGAQWQREQIKEALLSEVLPCFIHGGEADEVMAKLDEVLNKKK